MIAHKGSLPSRWHQRFGRWAVGRPTMWYPAACRRQGSIHLRPCSLPARYFNLDSIDACRLQPLPHPGPARRTPCEICGPRRQGGHQLHSRACRGRSGAVRHLPSYRWPGYPSRTRLSGGPASVASSSRQRASKSPSRRGNVAACSPTRMSARRSVAIVMTKQTLGREATLAHRA